MLRYGLSYVPCHMYSFNQSGQIMIPTPTGKFSQSQLLHLYHLTLSLTVGSQKRMLQDASDSLPASGRT